MHWKTQSDMRAGAGGGAAALIPMMLCIIPAVAFVVAGVFMAGLEDEMGRSGVLALYWCLIIAVSAAVAAAGLYILYEKGVPLFDSIGERRAVRETKTTPQMRKNGFLK